MNSELDEYKEKYYVLLTEVSSLTAERENLQASIREYSREIDGANSAMLLFKSKLNKSFMDAAKELNEKHEVAFENLQKELFAQMAKKDTQILELRKQLKASPEKSSHLTKVVTPFNNDVLANLAPASISPKTSNVLGLGSGSNVEKVPSNGSANLAHASISPKTSNVLDLGSGSNVEKMPSNGTANLAPASISPKTSNVLGLGSGSNVEKVPSNVSTIVLPSVEFKGPNSAKKTSLEHNLSTDANSKLSLEEISNEYYSKHKVLIKLYGYLN